MVDWNTLTPTQQRNYINSWAYDGSGSWSQYATANNIQNAPSQPQVTNTAQAGIVSQTGQATQAVQSTQQIQKTQADTIREQGLQQYFSQGEMSEAARNELSDRYIELKIQGEQRRYATSQQIIPTSSLPQKVQQEIAQSSQPTRYIQLTSGGEDIQPFHLTPERIPPKQEIRPPFVVAAPPPPVRLGEPRPENTDILAGIYGFLTHDPIKEQENKIIQLSNEANSLVQRNVQLGFLKTTDTGYVWTTPKAYDNYVTQVERLNQDATTFENKWKPYIQNNKFTGTEEQYAAYLEDYGRISEREKEIGTLQSQLVKDHKAYWKDGQLVPKTPSDASVLAYKSKQIDKANEVLTGMRADIRTSTGTDTWKPSTLFTTDRINTIIGWTGLGRPLPEYSLKSMDLFTGAQAAITAYEANPYVHAARGPSYLTYTTATAIHLTPDAVNSMRQGLIDVPPALAFSLGALIPAFDYGTQTVMKDIASVPARSAMFTPAAMAVSSAAKIPLPVASAITLGIGAVPSGQYGKAFTGGIGMTGSMIASDPIRFGTTILVTKYGGKVLGAGARAAGITVEKIYVPQETSELGNPLWLGQGGRAIEMILQNDKLVVTRTQHAPSIFKFLARTGEQAGEPTTHGAKGVHVYLPKEELLGTGKYSMSPFKSTGTLSGDLIQFAKGVALRPRVYVMELEPVKLPETLKQRLYQSIQEKGGFADLYSEIMDIARAQSLETGRPVIAPSPKMASYRAGYTGALEFEAFAVMEGAQAARLPGTLLSGSKGGMTFLGLTSEKLGIVRELIYEDRPSIVTRVTWTPPTENAIPATAFDVPRVAGGIVFAEQPPSRFQIFRKSISDKVSGISLPKISTNAAEVIRGRVAPALKETGQSLLFPARNIRANWNLGNMLETTIKGDIARNIAEQYQGALSFREWEFTKHGPEHARAVENTLFRIRSENPERLGHIADMQIRAAAKMHDIAKISAGETEIPHAEITAKLIRQGELDFVTEVGQLTAPRKTAVAKAILTHTKAKPFGLRTATIWRPTDFGKALATADRLQIGRMGVPLKTRFLFEFEGSPETWGIKHGAKTFLRELNEMDLPIGAHTKFRYDYRYVPYDIGKSGATGYSKKNDYPSGCGLVCRSIHDWMKENGVKETKLYSKEYGYTGLSSIAYGRSAPRQDYTSKYSTTAATPYPKYSAYDYLAGSAKRSYPQKYDYTELSYPSTYAKQYKENYPSKKYSEGYATKYPSTPYAKSYIKYEPVKYPKVYNPLYSPEPYSPKYPTKYPPTYTTKYKPQTPPYTPPYKPPTPSYVPPIPPYMPPPTPPFPDLGEKKSSRHSRPKHPKWRCYGEKMNVWTPAEMSKALPARFLIGSQSNWLGKIKKRKRDYTELFY